MQSATDGEYTKSGRNSAAFSLFIFEKGLKYKKICVIMQIQKNKRKASGCVSASVVGHVYHDVLGDKGIR